MTLDLPASSLTAQVWQVSAALIWDRQTQQLSAVAQDDKAVWCSQIWADWDALTAADHELETSSLGAFEIIEEPAECFLQGVAHCRDYILAGDVFQVNLSRQWQARFTDALSPIQVFARLRASNPAPFSALLSQPEWGIVSSSPERLVRVRNGMVDTRPIAGTRRRGDNEADDDLLRHELTLHPKEQAEHVMLLDLERNDLGRVCVPGSVRVDELMSIESYTHVHHIVSNVCGRLTSGTTAKAVIDAVFPGGTITGCPKVRCMEIIAELEQVPRGVYTGSLGYVSLDGQMDFNILIRSFYWKPHQLTFRAGAGIVYDSVAEAELEETRHKAKGLIKALG